MLQQSGNTLYHLIEDEELKEKIRVMEKRDHDEASALNTARREGKAEGRQDGRAEMKNALISQWRKKGYSEEEILNLLTE